MARTDAIDGPIVLVGLMGTGKTTVGTLVARRLHRRFLDSDRVIEERTGRTVREIFESDGEPAFRALETEALRDALSSPQPVVVAAAGGVVLSAENRRILKELAGRVVWLTADPGVLAARVRSGDHRPLLDDDPGGVLRRMATDREPLYREVADRIVSTERRTPSQVAEAVLA